MLTTNLIRVAAASAAFSLVWPLAAANKFPDYPARAASDCAVKASVSGITAGVQPVEDLKEQKTYLGMDLTPKGFLPVYVTLQNDSAGSFLFDKTKLTFGDSDSAGTSPQNRSQAGEAIGLMSAVMISPAGLFIAAKLISNASLVQQNILKKEMQSKTLSPGTAVSGFLYLPVPKNGPRAKMRLRVPVTRSGSDETVILDLVF